jgi:hypothetical protein
MLCVARDYVELICFFLDLLIISSLFQ